MTTCNNDRWVVWHDGGESFTVFDDYEKAQRARGCLDTIEYKTPAQVAELEKYGRTGWRCWHCGEVIEDHRIRM